MEEAIIEIPVALTEAYYNSAALEYLFWRVAWSHETAATWITDSYVDYRILVGMTFFVH